jgi:hypothetical protein
MSAFTIDMSSPILSGFTGGLGGPNSGDHLGAKWFNRFGMDLAAPAGTEVHASFDAYVTVFHPHDPSKDTSKEYGADLFMRSPNDMMGGFYTHITDVPTGIAPGPTVIARGALLGKVYVVPGGAAHLHLALVEIIGGLPGGRYMGVNLYELSKAMATAPTTTRSVTFQQNGSAPIAK